MNVRIQTLGTILLFFAVLSISACTFPPRLYRMDVRQGNYLTEVTIKKLKIGQTKEEVRDILGTPTLTHFFEQDRWDYYYYLKPGNGDPIIEKRISIYFKGQKVARLLEADRNDTR